MLSVITAFLSAYLAFTNSLATTIEDALYDNSATPEHTASLRSIASHFETIPKILVDQAGYQDAAIIKSEQFHTTDPIEALVNIFCQYEINDEVRTITGTGFFIDSKGVILTNAHVAQFLLLEGGLGNAECVVRTGNPAEARYRAELLYIPPAWVVEHAALIDAKAPTGTGERDYALLYTTGSVTTAAMPAYFPALAFDTALLPISYVGEPIVTAGYPAETLFAAGDAGVALTPQRASTSVGELLTFGSNFADVFSMLGTSMGERGASGGPVLDKNGNVIGMISTRGEDNIFGPGSLRAITISYIDRTIKEEANLSLAELLASDLATRARIYTSVMAPLLQQMLIDEL